MILKVMVIGKVNYIRLPTDVCKEYDIKGGTKLKVEDSDGRLIVYLKGVE